MLPSMPNPWTGRGNPYTRKEVVERLRATLKKGDAIIAAGAGTGISAKFIERGGADLIIIYNSGRFHLRHDGLRRCQCDRDGDRRIRSAPGGGGMPGHLRRARDRSAPAHVALA